MLLVKVRLHFKRATVKRKNNRKQSKLPLRYLTLAAYKCSMEKKEKRKGGKKKKENRRKNRCFSSPTKYSLLNLPSKAFKDRK